MASELSFTDTSNVATTTIPWSQVQRTDVTTTLQVRLWNELVASGTATTATRIQIRPGFQMNVGEPFIYDDAVEPGGSQWVVLRVTGFQNPTGASGGDYIDWTSSWYRIGGSAVFSVNANIPPRTARGVECYLSPENTGSATSINAMKLSVSDDVGVRTLPVFNQQRSGDGTVFEGDWSKYYLLRGKEDEGIRVKQSDPPDPATMIVEAGTAHLGSLGVVSWPLFELTIPDPDLDGDAVNTDPGEEYTILLSVNPNPTPSSPGRIPTSSIVATKGSKATTGNSVAPALPSANHVPLAEVVKRDLANIGTSDIDYTIAKHGGATITYDGTGNDIDKGPGLHQISGAVQIDEGRRNVGGLANATHYVKESALGVNSVNTTEPGDGFAFDGRVVVAGGAVTSYSNRQQYHARSSYRARRRTITDSHLYIDSNSAIQFFGRLDRVATGPLPQTVTFAAGHKVAINWTTHTTTGTITATGTDIDGGGTESNATVETFFVNKVNDWITTENRWFSTNAGWDADVVVAAGTAAGSASVYRCEPWDNNGKPFHIAQLRCEFVPSSNAATIRVRLYKIPKNGAGVTTVFDSGLKSNLDGDAAGILGIPCQLVLHQDNGSSTESDTEEVWTVADDVIVNPWEGEWIYVEATDLVDIEVPIRMHLTIYDLFI